MPYFVYILRCRDKTLYTGITTNLERRVREHNGLMHGLPFVALAKKGAKYTRSRRPVKLVWSKKFKNRSAALRAEWKVRQLTKAEKLKLILK